MAEGTRKVYESLRRNIHGDLTDRSTWATKQNEIVRRRLSARRKQKTKPYKGAPNFVEPIIDDNVREKTDQEISMLLNAPVMAHAIPLSGEISAEDRANLEHAFDTYLRHIVEIRPILEEGIDMKNERGFTTFWQVRSANNRMGIDLPIPLVVDTKDIIVPKDTKDLQSAERICRVIRLSPMKLRKMAADNGWDKQAANKIIEQVKNGSTTEDGSDEESMYEVKSDLVGLLTSETEEANNDEGGNVIKNIVIWEVYRYATEEDEERNEELLRDRRMVSVFCPDVTAESLAEYPWREDDVVTVLSDDLAMEEILTANADGREPELVRRTPGKDKAWPGVQNRNESRSNYWYDSRGIGELVMDNQIKATQMQNAKSVMTDYFSSPLYSGNIRNSGNISFRPGSKVPDDFAWVVPPSIPSQFDFDINQDRATASKRAGAGGQNLFSAEQSRGNAVEKTATEVQNESARINMVSSTSVDRFNTPMGQLFQLIWEDLQRLRPAIPIIAGREGSGKILDSLYDLDILWVPASSAKTLNPELQLQRSMGIANFALQLTANGLPVDPQAIWATIASYWDPNLTADWVIDPEEAGPQGQPPVYMQIEQLRQGIEQMAQMMQQIGQNVQAGLKLADENASRNDKQEEAIKKNSESIADLNNKISRQLQSLQDRIKAKAESNVRNDR